MLGLGSAFEKLSQNMTWNFPWSETIRKRAIRYLLQRYVGQFLQETLSLDQLSVDLTNGTGIIRDLSLDIHALNEVAEQLNLPFKFIDGYIGEILVNIPWRNLFNENCFVGISDLKLVLHPKVRDGEISLVDSMIDSMSTSMQIAQDCLNTVTQEADIEENVPDLESKNKNESSSNIDAIEHFAKAIDTVLNKIKVRFSNSVIRLEYHPKSSISGIALEIEIDNIDYFDEAGFDKNNASEKKKLQEASFTSKKFLIEGVSLFSNEYSTQQSPCHSRESLLESIKTEKKVKDDDEFHDSHCSDSSILIDNNLLNNSSEEVPIKNSILIAKLYNRQEIKLILKKEDACNGPKVHFEVNCGSLITFLSPRQIHLLMEFSEGLISPETVENTEFFIEKSYKIKQKPMNHNDFTKIERELIKQLTPPPEIPVYSLNNQDGWSAPSNVINDEDFLPINPDCVVNKKIMTSSKLSEASDLEGSFISTVSNAGPTLNKTVSDDMMTTFKITLNSLCMVVLHEDVLMPSSNSDEILTRVSLTEMQRVANMFFSSIAITSTSEHCYEEYVSLKSKLEGLCSLSHLRFIGTSVIIDGTEKSVSNKWEMKTFITAGWCELLEILNDSDNDTPKLKEFNLIKFKKNESNSADQFDTPMKPKITVNINQSQHLPIIGKIQRQSTPKLDAKILLEECIVDVDISIINRISVLLNKQSVILKEEKLISPDKLPPSHLDNQAFFQEVMDEILSKPEMQISVEAKCPMLSVKLYFPIPDLRPHSDMNRMPWWKKNVRKDILTMKVEDFYLEANLESTSSYQLLGNDVHFLYQEAEYVQPVSLLRASRNRGIEKGFNPIRIFIQSFPVNTSSNLDDHIIDKNNVMAKSMMGFMEEVDDSKADIFHKRKMASQQEDHTNELTIPAEDDELDKFIIDTLNNVQFDIDILMADVQFILPSKHIYEMMYNRLVSDLLLWKPSAPQRCTRPMHYFDSMMNNLRPENYYSTCDFKNFSSSNLDDSIKDHNATFDSMYEPNLSYSAKKNTTKISSEQTFIGLKVKIRNAVGSILTPCRDNDNKIVSGRHGDVTFKFDKGFLFIANGYKGNIDATHGCLKLNSIDIFHKRNAVTSNSPSLLDLDIPISTKHMNAVLYPSDMLCRVGGGNSPINENKDAVSLCFKLDFDVAKNENVLNLVGGMFGLTLRHYMTSSNESWMAQLGDMFNVEDYPIEGYVLPDIMNELNFHFENCGIDYRPLNLSLKSYIAIDSLAISSNVTIKGNSSVLLIIVEDAGFFLSQHFVGRKVNLKEDYVCVMDLGVLELCLKIENNSSGPPFQDLFFSNNVFNIRTCSDSFKALMELLIYLTNEGDLIQEPDNLFNEKKTILKSPQQTATLFKHDLNEHQNIVENLMEEAMVESTSPCKLNSTFEEVKGVNEFLFPDENKLNKNSSILTEVAYARKPTTALLDTASALEEALLEECSNFYNENTYDDDYCVLDDDPGTGIRSLSGKPKVKQHQLEDINIIDEYFDLAKDCSNKARLNASNHLAKPLQKYFIQEISIVWYMYGGTDFTFEKAKAFNDKNGNHKIFGQRQNPLHIGFGSHKTINVAKRQPIVSFENGDATILSGRSSPASLNASPNISRSKNINWIAVGGKNRCHNTAMEIQLNKIKLKYEIFPLDHTVDSRYELWINDIEIRDRLTSSKINKFLYQFSNEYFPKQASSNMVQIKSIAKRSDPSVGNSETNLYISVRPIRLNIDQDALIFLCQFGEDVMSFDKESEQGEEEKPSVTVSHAPVMSVNQNNLPEGKINKATMQTETDSEIRNAQFPIYFRHVVFSPEVPIRIDYHGKHIDINSQYGALAGLIIGLGQLDHSEITLKRQEFKSGVLGVNKLTSSVLNEWIVDIRKNQLPSILGGVGPMHSFVKLFSGLKDLVVIPIEQYNKDGRVFLGLQKGTSAFTSSSAYAVLDLTGRLVGCIQSAAETMYDIVSSGPSVRSKSYKNRGGQPKDIREGVTAAFGLVRNGLGDTANAIIKVASEEHSHKGMSGAVGGVLRQIPPSVMQPIIIASEATCTVIGGMTNQLVPEARKEAAEKWKA